MNGPMGAAPSEGGPPPNPLQPLARRLQVRCRRPQRHIASPDERAPACLPACLCACLARSFTGLTRYLFLL